MIVKNDKKSPEVQEMVKRLKARQQERREEAREKSMDEELEKMFEKRQTRINTVVIVKPQEYVAPKNGSIFHYVAVLLVIILIFCSVIATINGYIDTAIVLNVLVAFVALFGGLV